MKTVVFGTYDKTAHPRIAVLIDGLRARGHDVVEVNAPLGVNTKARVAMLRHPWRVPLLLAKILVCWLKLMRRSRHIPRPGAVIVGYLGHFDVHLARVLFPKSQIVLDQMTFAVETARDRRLASPWRLRLLERIDRWAVQRADVVLVDTSQRRTLVPPTYAGDVVVVPVGASNDWFALGDQRQPRPVDEPLRVIFFGLFTPLQGAPVIGAALGQLADVSNIEITMVGSGQDLAEAKEAARANHRVRWQEWAKPAELAELVLDSDVCLGIFGGGEKALSVVPNKVYQGAAAGCALITSDTEPQREAFGEAAMYVTAEDSVALARTLRTLATDRAEVARLQQAARDRANARYRPVAVVGALVDRLNLAGPRTAT